MMLHMQLVLGDDVLNPPTRSKGMAAPLTDDIRQIAERWLWDRLPDLVHDTVSLGLPEWDDRLNLWRVALVHENSRRHQVGEIQVDSLGNIYREPVPAMVVERLRAIDPRPTTRRPQQRAITFPSHAQQGHLG